MKFYPRFSFLLLVFLSVFAVSVFGQTISVTSNFDTTIPYSPGSTIAVPFHVDNTSGCITQNNVFSLYLSNAAGTTYSSTPLATVTGFYATFINTIIPAGTAPGTNYKVKITASSNPTVVFGESATFKISTGAVITAGISSGQSINTAHPEVFGNCNSNITSLDIQDVSVNATSQTASFFNESSQTTEASVITAPPGGIGSFTPNKTNYTIIVKAGNGLVNGTKAYTLINNPSNSNFGFSGTQSVCLGSTLTFNIDITSTDGIQYNYPANTYKFDWGDNTSTTLTFCDISKLGGHVSHQYTTSSCGNVVGTTANVFKISFEPNNPYCGSFNAVSTTAKISAPPNNIITGSATACTGVPVQFTNNSYPGEDPSSAPGNCVDYAGARYTWYVDGVAKLIGVAKSVTFSPTLTVGPHVISLRLNNNPTSCSVSDGTFNVCVQDKPVPSFTLPVTTTCLSGTPIAATNTTVVNNSCYVNTYKWTVTGGTVTYAGGTSATSVNPQFVFATGGTYLINMTVRDACGNDIAAPQKQIVVNTNPSTTMSGAVALCGPQVLNFSPTGGNTQTTFSGTPTTQPTTYTWTVTGGAYSFTNGTNLNTQYPQITLTDFAVYTVSVTHQNSCGTITKSQQITIQQAPTVSAGSDNTICPANTYQLTGSITGNTASAQLPVTWTITGGDGSLDDIHSLTPIYTLGPIDKANGRTAPIKFTMTVKTNLAAPCNTIQPTVNISITPPDKLTSAVSGETCSGSNFSYTIQTANAGASYNWTTNVQIGSVSGLPASGSGPVLINSVLTNNSLTTDAKVICTITSTTNGCPSTLTYTLTVHPKPILSGVTPTATICSGTATNITLPAGMNYTWVASVVTGSASGFTQKTAAGAVTSIANTLTNTSNADAVVRYRITPYASTGSCPGDYVDVLVTVSPATTIADADISNATPNPTVHICGTAAPTSKQLNANPATVGTGKWTQPTGQTATITDDTKYNTSVSGLVAGQSYKFTWTISGCSTSSSDITYVIDAPSKGGNALAPDGTNKLTICNGDIASITLANSVGNLVRWERSTDGLSWATVVPTSSSAPNYTFAGLTQSASYRAVLLSGSCATDNSTQVDVTVNPATAQASVGSPQTLCNQTGTTLSGNIPPAGTTGKWTVKSGQTGVTFDDATKRNAFVTGLVGGQTYIFTWTLSGLSPCGPTSADLQIVNLAPITNNNITVTGSNNVAGNSTIVCRGSDVKLDGTVPNGGGGSTSYNYQWEQSTDNGVTWTAIANTQPVTVQIVQKTYFRRTVISATCNDVSPTIVADISAPVSDNTLPVVISACINTTLPGPILGSTPKGGDGINFIYKWQQSTNANTGYTDIAGATGKDYQPTQVFTVDIYYRRIVTTTYCNGAAGNTSQPVQVKVIPDVVAKFTATTQVSCAPFNITSANISATADPNADTYTWLAITAGGAVSTIGPGLTFPGYTIPSDGTTVTIKLVVTSAGHCKQDELSMDFSTIKNTSFTGVNVSGSNCGPLTYKFTNTTNATINTTYKWDFGDGTTYTGLTPPNHTFQPDATGNDANYTVTLTAGNCSGTLSSQKITVYPAAPKAYIDPGASTGCAPYTITVKNITPGTNSSYVFTLYDETNRLVQTITKTNNDKSDAVFAAVNTVNTVTYTVRMITTNLCGTATQSAVVPIVITSTGISARMAVSPTTNTGIVAGCAPFLSSFQNLSTGGNSYVYNIYDINFNPIKSIPTTGNISYNFDVAGTYYVSIGVFSSCSGGVESPKTKVTVYPVAAPAFAATTATTGCTQLTVSFANKTPDVSPTAPASSFTYTWDFGDGSPTYTGFTPPAHTYDYKRSPYTVTLSVVNTNGCFSSTNKAGYITVNPPPLTDFTAQPDTITAIPNYTFAFVDKTTNAPVNWKWDFGDGTTSNKQNPTHTYADTGRYKVTLTTITQYGCTDTKTHIARITGVPGQLYVPNAFMPTSLSQELRVFTVKGSGLKTYNLRIINNWGQVVFETTKLSTKGEPAEFWDGKYKGQDAPQGVYAWEVSALFINGTDWKGMSYKGSAPRRSGTLTLIR